MPRSGPANRERIAALCRALIVTDVQRVRPSLFGFVLIILTARSKIGTLWRMLQRLAGSGGRYRSLQQTWSLILIVLHTVIAFLNDIRASEFGAMVIQFIAIGRRSDVLW